MRPGLGGTVSGWMGERDSLINRILVRVADLEETGMSVAQARKFDGLREVLDAQLMDFEVGILKKFDLVQEELKKYFLELIEELIVRSKLSDDRVNWLGETINVLVLQLSSVKEVAAKCSDLQSVQAELITANFKGHDDSISDMRGHINSLSQKLSDLENLLNLRDEAVTNTLDTYGDKVVGLVEKLSANVDSVIKVVGELLKKKKRVAPIKPTKLIKAKID